MRKSPSGDDPEGLFCQENIRFLVTFLWDFCPAVFERRVLLMHYKMKNGKVFDEEGRTHEIFGIEAVGENGKILSEFPDIFSDRAEAECFAALCNEKALSLIHLKDVLEDVVGGK
ncbi:MAG: hypothetical protein IJ306_10815 [Oscillospiraceae bacterium]|nr:hypothetical protein [Oscillospiraceae bacterium]